MIRYFKKNSLVCAFTLMVLSASVASASEVEDLCPEGRNIVNKYDVNKSGGVNALDILAMINHLQRQTRGEEETHDYCVNLKEGEEPNALDVLKMISYVRDPGYGWEEGEWDSCDRSNGKQTKVVECRDKEGQKIEDGSCSEARPDPTEQDCESDTNRQTSPFHHQKLMFEASDLEVRSPSAFESFWHTVKGMMKHLKASVTSEPPAPEAPTSQTQNYTVPSSLPLSVIADSRCLAVRQGSGSSEFFDDYLTPPSNLDTEAAFHDDIYDITLGRNIDYDQLWQEVSDDACVYGITKTNNNLVSNAQISVDITTAQVDTSSDGVKVAHIHFEKPLKEEKGKTFSLQANIINDYRSGRVQAQDALTAYNQKVGRFHTNHRGVLYKHIKDLVNTGVEVITIHSSPYGNFKAYEADPVVGHAIYKAIEKKAFFVLSAANAVKIDANDQPIPGYVISPKDDRPPFQRQDLRTADPAGWGRYFKGALTITALKPNGGEVDTYSNYGEAVELGAIPKNTQVPSDRIAIKTFDKSKLIAQQLEDVAVLVKQHFAQRGIKVGPWLLEDIILNGSPQSSERAQYYQGGRQLDLQAFADYFDTIRTLSGDQLRSTVRSENHRGGDGWKPDEDIHYNEKIIISSPRPVVDPGETIQLSASLIRTDGTFKDITDEVFWTSSNDAKAFVHTKGGQLEIGANVAENEAFTIIGHYLGLEDQFAVHVGEPSEGDLIDFIIDHIPQEDQSQNQLLWGEPAHQFAALKFYWRRDVDLCATEPTPSSLESIPQSLSHCVLKVDLTGYVDWSSSIPTELQEVDGAPGVFSTMEAYGGKNYVVTAIYEGLTKEIPVYVIPREAEDYFILSPLGYSVFKGDTMRVQSVLKLVDEVDERPFLATEWEVIEGDLSLTQTDGRETSFDTTDAEIGRYTLQATTIFKGQGRDEVLTNTFTFQVTHDFQRLELMTKTPVINYRDRAVFFLRRYDTGNRYVVVSPEFVRWESSDPVNLPIDDQGIVYASSRSLKGEGIQDYKITAHYAGRTVDYDIRVAAFNVVTGNGSDLAYIDIDSSHPGIGSYYSGRVRGRYFSIPPQTEFLWAGKGNFYTARAFYLDGRVRDIWKEASWFIDEVDFSSPYYQDYGFKLPEKVMGGGREAVIKAVYEGEEVSLPIYARNAELQNFDATVSGRATGAATTLDIERLADDRFKITGTYTDLRSPSLSVSLYWHVKDEGSDDIRRVKATTVDWGSSEWSQLMHHESLSLRQLESKTYEINYSSPFRGDGSGDVKSGTLYVEVEAREDSGVPVEIWDNDSASGVPYYLGRHKASTAHMGHETARHFGLGIRYDNGESRALRPSDLDDLELTLTDGSGEIIENAGYAIGSYGHVSMLSWGENFLNQDVVLNIKHKDLDSTILKSLKTVGVLDKPQTEPRYRMSPPSYYDIDPRVPDIGLFPINQAPTPRQTNNNLCNDPVNQQPLSVPGYGTKTHPFIVCTAEQLYNIETIMMMLIDESGNGEEIVREYLPAECDNKRFQGNETCNYGHVRLGANLDFSDLGNLEGPILLKHAIYLDGNGHSIDDMVMIDREHPRHLFKTISCDGCTYRYGSRNHRTKKIQNLVINNPVIRGKDRTSILGQLDYVHNVHVVGGSVWGGAATAILVNSQSASYSGIRHIGIHGTTLNIEGDHIGSIIPQHGGIIQDVYVEADIASVGVQGRYRKIGGIVGSMGGGNTYFEDKDIYVSGGKIKNATFKGSINVGHGSGGQAMVGGIVGLNSGALLENVTVEADIVSTGSKVGGVVGQSACREGRYWYGCRINGATFSGSVIGGSDYARRSEVGGIAGTYEGGMIFNTQATGSVKGIDHVGGLVGSMAPYVRLKNNRVEAHVSSSKERHGGFVGFVENPIHRFHNLDRNGQPVVYEPKPIYEGSNQWNAQKTFDARDIGIVGSDGRDVDHAGIAAIGFNTGESAMVLEPRITDTAQNIAVVRSNPIFSWRPVSAARYYEINLKSASGTTIFNEDNIRGQSFQSTDPLSSGDYTFKVRGISADGSRGQWSQTLKVQIQ